MGHFQLGPLRDVLLFRYVVLQIHLRHVLHFRRLRCFLYAVPIAASVGMSLRRVVVLKCPLRNVPAFVVGGEGMLPESARETEGCH